MPKPMMILIAGPYRSGTGDDPTRMAANLRRLEEAAWPIFQKGHVPMIGEWVALPVLHGAGGGKVGDPLYDQVMHPTAHRQYWGRASAVAALAPRRPRMA